MDWYGGDSNHEEPDEVELPEYENQEKLNAGVGGQPFYYGGEPGEPSRVNLQGNGQPRGEETSWNNGGEADARPAEVLDESRGYTVGLMTSISSYFYK